ncbi:hypothetical protein ABT340_35740 [Streptosporangium sp. NPDC000239]|uniref:hypothetical protein n=1 Tax=Streptosporangium sp. NPDC000239 TaxID=3154248 RepID=UPI00331653B8
MNVLEQILPAVAGGLLALGGVALTQVFSGKREKRQLRHQQNMISLQARREAYAAFARASRLLGRHERQLLFSLHQRDGVRKMGEAEKRILGESNNLVANLADAEAIVQIHASGQVKPSIARLYAAHNAFEPIFTDAYLGRHYDRAAAEAALEEMEEAEKIYFFACRRDLALDLLDEDRAALTGEHPLAIEK